MGLACRLARGALSGPYFVQDGYQAQVPQHLIDTYHIILNHLKILQTGNNYYLSFAIILFFFIYKDRFGQEYKDKKNIQVCLDI